MPEQARQWVAMRGPHLKLALTRATADMGPMPRAPPVAACSVGEGGNRAQLCRCGWECVCAGMCVARAWHLASAAVPAACCAQQRLLPAALDSACCPLRSTAPAARCARQRLAALPQPPQHAAAAEAAAVAHPVLIEGCVAERDVGTHSFDCREGKAGKTGGRKAVKDQVGSRARAHEAASGSACTACTAQ